jgi:hypothetical protein
MSKTAASWGFGFGSFGFLSSFVIRHSDFKADERDHDHRGAADQDHRGTYGCVMRGAGTGGLFSVRLLRAADGSVVVSRDGGCIDRQR